MNKTGGGRQGCSQAVFSVWSARCSQHALRLRLLAGPDRLSLAGAPPDKARIGSRHRRCRIHCLQIHAISAQGFWCSCPGGWLMRTCRFPRCGLVQPSLAHEQADLYGAEKGLFHKGIDPLQHFGRHKVQLLRQHGILCPYKQNIPMMPHRPRQRRKIRPHDHAPVEPELLQTRPRFPLAGGSAKPRHYRGHDLHGVYGLRIFLSFAEYGHYRSLKTDSGPDPSRDFGVAGRELLPMPAVNILTIC